MIGNKHESPTLLRWFVAGPGRVVAEYGGVIYSILCSPPLETYRIEIDGIHYSGVQKNKKVAKEACEDLLARKLVSLGKYPRPNKEKKMEIPSPEVTMVIDVSQPGIDISLVEPPQEVIHSISYEDVLKEVVASAERTKIVGPKGFYVPSPIKYLKEYLKREDISSELYDRAYDAYCEEPIYPQKDEKVIKPKSRISVIDTLEELLKIYPSLDQRPDQIEILQKNDLEVEDVSPSRYKEARDRIDKTRESQPTKEEEEMSKVKEALTNKPKKKRKFVLRTEGTTLVEDKEEPKLKREPRILEGAHRLSRVIAWCVEHEWELEEIQEMVDTLCPDTPDSFVKKCYKESDSTTPADLDKTEIKQVKRAASK